MRPREEAQTTPQKLGQFAEAFFSDPEHIRPCVDKVVPSVRAWLTFIGSEASPHDVADAVLRLRFATAKADLLKVAEITYDSELYEQSMLRLMTRWDTDGAAYVVDQVIQRGIKKDGTLAIEAPPLPKQPSSRPRTRKVAFLEKWSRQQRANEELALERAKPNRLARLKQQLEVQRAR